MSNRKNIAILIFAVGFLFLSCDYGQLGNADKTNTYDSGDVFNERLSFLSGVWYSHYAGIGRLDGYRIRKWSDITAEDKIKFQTLFPALNIDSPRTYSTQDTPGSSDYILLYDGSVYGQKDDGSGGRESGGGFIGLIRAINIFNNDKKRCSLIIEYFEDTSEDPTRGEKPFYGIYIRVLSPDLVQMANPADLAGMYGGKSSSTATATVEEAIKFFNVENEAEFISWGVVIPQSREKE